MNIIHDLKKFIVELVAKSFFFTKLTNPKDISDPIVKKLDSLKPIPTDHTPVVQGLKAVQTAIESKTETDIRPQLKLLGDILRDEIGKLDREVVVKNDLSQILGLFKTNGDKKDIVTALKSIEKLIPKVKEVPDYTLLLSEIITAVENVNFHVDLSLIEKFLMDIKPFEIPSNLIDGERIKVILSDEQLNKMKGSTVKSMGRSVAYETVWQKNIVGNRINPATEEGQTAIKDAIDNINIPENVGGATEDKQDVQINLLTERLGDLNVVLRDMMNVIANPGYVDKSANAIRNQVQSGTITTVTTVTGMTNIDGYQGKSLMISADAAAWALVVRNTIS